MTITVYVEGGGDSPQLKGECRKGFRELLRKAGFAKLKVVACGSRNQAFKNFKNALSTRKEDDYPILLVDSEDLVASSHRPNNALGAWQHLASRDGWPRPRQAKGDQAQLMVTAMETWLVADPKTLTSHFPRMNVRALPTNPNLEDERKKDVAAKLKGATSHSSKGSYQKGRDSFDLLSKVDPAVLRGKLLHFRRFIETLAAHT